MSGCGCAPCGASARGRLLALEGIGGFGLGGIDAGECETFSVHLSGEAIDAFKRRLDPFFVATDGAVDRCAGLPPEEKAAWSAFYLTWKAHLATETSWFFAYEAWRATCGYSRTLDAWRKRLESTACTIPGPSVIDVPTQGGELLSAVKWGAAAIIVAAVVYGVSRVV